MVLVWRDARVGALERFAKPSGIKAGEGSNPSPSAITTMKLVHIFSLLVVIGFVAGCAVPEASKERTSTNTVAKVAPVKLVKNDPDHIHFIYPDGTVVSQVWTNASR